IPEDSTSADIEEDEESPQKEAKIIDLEPSGCAGDVSCQEPVTATCGTCKAGLCDRHKFTAYWNKTIVGCMPGHLPLPPDFEKDLEQATDSSSLMQAVQDVDIEPQPLKHPLRPLHLPQPPQQQLPQPQPKPPQPPHPPQPPQPSQPLQPSLPQTEPRKPPPQPPQ